MFLSPKDVEKKKKWIHALMNQWNQIGMCSMRAYTNTNTDTDTGTGDAHILKNLNGVILIFFDDIDNVRGKTITTSMRRGERRAEERQEERMERNGQETARASEQGWFTFTNVILSITITISSTAKCQITTPELVI